MLNSNRRCCVRVLIGGLAGSMIGELGSFGFYDPVEKVGVLILEYFVLY